MTSINLASHWLAWTGFSNYRPSEREACALPISLMLSLCHFTSVGVITPFHYCHCFFKAIFLLSMRLTLFSGMAKSQCALFCVIPTVLFTPILTAHTTHHTHTAHTQHNQISVNKWFFVNKTKQTWKRQ